MNKENFYTRFFKMYFLLVFQNVLTLSVNLADNVMLGAYSEISLSGVTAVNQIQFVFQQMVNAIGDGAVILGAQYWGKRDLLSMKKIGALAMRMAIAIAILLFLLASLVPHGLMGLFTTEEAIIQEGVRYLGIIKYTYLLFAVTVILLAALRSIEIVKVAFYLSVSTLCINCCINYVLIYGRFGAPRLGVTGAAIGTLTARVVECLAVLWYVLKKDTVLKMRLKDFLQTDKVLRRDYVRLTLPVFLVQSLWGLNTAMQTAILGHMTARAIAANSVASNLFLLVKSTAVGAVSTASVIIGKAVGEGNMETVKSYAKRLQVLFLSIGILSGIALFFLRIPILRLYDLSDATRQMADSFLIILSVVCVTMSYQMPTNNGIIRGGGNTMFSVKMDLISIWGIVIPLSLIMAFVVKAPPVVVVCCLNADQVFKCVPAFLKVNYGRWVRKLTR